MDKFLAASEQEVINFFKDKFSSIEDMEHDLGVTFADMNGNYMDDDNDDFNYDEVNYSQYKVVESGALPEKYPCLIVHWFEKDFDRFGSVEHRIFEYVYQDDFNN
jgi:hypothetical protein